MIGKKEIRATAPYGMIPRRATPQLISHAIFPFVLSFFREGLIIGQRIMAMINQIMINIVRSDSSSANGTFCEGFSIRSCSAEIRETRPT